MENLLKGKNILIMGVANKWSIAWGIAQSCLKAGANLIFTYQGERTKDAVEELVSGIPGALLYPCDVTSDQEIIDLFENIKRDVGVLHGVVHSLAFAKKEELAGAYYNTSREGYLLAQNISAYSLVAVARHALPLMTEGGSIVTLTYIGGERVVPNYNVMGVAKAALECSVKYLAVDLGPYNIRVNAISAGPIKTLAARGVKNFSEMLKTYEEKVPLRRNIDQSDVGDAALFLLSHLSRGITGEVIHVDAGYHILG
ncbi:enoyl-[acyl-carrier protein] reductase I [Caldicoprobacter guelmensis]|uniref:enoyl-ACP reductase FabI n=1 Tax=Caldicoprobacter guelmensis TaxID=1170224 RepID=UPI00195E4C47|nr:enoyl-ACP reductase FabI [Caldicoprobacter guelmensis]MBM7582334.1 enoyl-[acyl-carrier protein] reductase I [Caldicoprobacter guelmensis]